MKWNTCWQVEREKGISRKDLFRLVLEGKVPYKKTQKKGFLFDTGNFCATETSNSENEYLSFIEKYSNLFYSIIL